MKFILLTSSMALGAMANVTLEDAEDQIRGYGTDDQRKWFDLAFEYRLKLQKQETTNLWELKLFDNFWNTFKTYWSLFFCGV